MCTLMVGNVGSGIRWVILPSSLLWDKGVFLSVIRHSFIFQILRQLKYLVSLCDLKKKNNGREFLNFITSVE